MYRQARNTRRFLVLLLLGGLANLASRAPGIALGAAMTSINYLIYIGLLLFWIEAVRVRLLPSSARTSILSAACLMLLYMLIRIFKYRFAVTVIPMRYAVYAYCIPQSLIPALFLMTAIRIRRGRDDEKGKWNERLLLIPAAILVLIEMTNDLHSLVYIPRVDLSRFVLNTGTYSYGPVFYLLYVWMVLTAIPGLIILFKKAGQLPKKAVLLLTGDIVFWFGFILLNLLVFDRLPGGYHMFNNPELHIFGMLGIFEICIRYNLIPYNENYSGFFRELQIPVLITDRLFQPVYHSGAALSAVRSDLKAAAVKPVSLSPDEKLCGKPIRAGYVFWMEDESAVRRAQTGLLQANEMIEQENDLIRAETEQKEKDAYLQSRHRIYHEIAEELYPCQKKITQLLNEAVPGTANFREKISLVSVLNAYVKRKTNLLLLSAENESLSVNELYLALQESAGYLTLAGMQTTARLPEGGQLPAGRITALYDAFELIAEQLLGNAPSLMVSWKEDGLRLAAQTGRVPDLTGISLPVTFRKNEDILYMDISSGKDGEAV